MIDCCVCVVFVLCVFECVCLVVVNVMYCVKVFECVMVWMMMCVNVGMVAATTFDGARGDDLVELVDVMWYGGKMMSWLLIVDESEFLLFVLGV